MSTVAKCSIKNTRVTTRFVGVGVFKFFAAQTRCSYFGWLLCSVMEYTYLRLFWVGTHVVSSIVFVNVI